METFTLIIWLMMGQRFEETQIEGLSRAACGEHHGRIMADRGMVKSHCVSAAGRVILGPVERAPICAYGACGNTLPPGHKRV